MSQESNSSLMYKFVSNNERLAAFDEIWRYGIVGIALVHEDGTFLEANPAFCTLTEYAEAELRKLKFQDITHPADVDADEMLSEEVAKGQRAYYDMRKRYITKTGRVVWVVIRVTPVIHDGKFGFFLSQVSEILELSPPRLGKDYPASTPIPASKLLVRWLKDKWAFLALALTSIGIILAKAIEFLWHPPQF